MSRLFLLDGTALAYRSHFALARSGLTTAEGMPTGATYGFAMTLRRILETEEPDLIAVAMDAKGPTFRHERFPEYKATREKAPEEMIAQLPWIRETIEAHGIELFEVPGYEADDVIGTLARQAEAAGHDVFIVTGDKDFMQLVSDRVKLYNVFKRGEDLVVQGPEEVREKFGTTPDHVVDVLALMGDASDNVPGVKGIGEKGAIKLIGEFGSVDELLLRLEEVKGKAKEKIAADRDALLLSRELVTIDTHVPLERSLEHIGPARPDRERLVKLFGRLEFRTLADRIAHEGEPSREGTCEYRTVRTAAELDAMVEALVAAGSFSLDTETTSLFPLEASLVGLSFGIEGIAWYVPANLTPPVVDPGDGGDAVAALLERLGPVLTDPGLERTGQNAKYDWLVLGHQGALLPPPTFDTMVASFCASGAERGHGLDALALQYFGIKKIPTKELIGTGKSEITMDQVPIDQVAEYACEDADVTFRLRAVLEEELDKNEARELFETLEMPLVPVLTAMERRGIRLDVDRLGRLGKELEREQAQLEERVKELAGEGFNLNSTKALGTILFEKLRIQDEAGVKRPKRTKTGWATDFETLSTKYGDVEIVAKLLEYRAVTKLKSTYVDALPRYVNPETGRVHCSYSQVAAATGRLASSDPNLQNIPVRSERGRELRKAFVPREADEHGTWCLLAADYSQIELRVMAHLSGDEAMRRAFEEGADIHAATAARIFDVHPDLITREMRSQAKVINFGLLYGMGASRLARETGLSLSEAKDFIERYFASFPTVRAWMDRVLEEARECGYVETLFGRRRRIAGITSANARMRAFAENAAINTPVQGSAADIIKRAMIDLEAALSQSPLHAEMLLQVHDELVLECPLSELEATQAIVRDAMEHAVDLAVPLVVDFGHGANWLEAH
ncbi:MAG TPA: DNA polymerase I [Planctomycetes bacterium]|nr:DNA polymerase I [Planctomycetota bacterium]